MIIEFSGFFLWEWPYDKNYPNWSQYLHATKKEVLSDLMRNFSPTNNMFYYEKSLILKIKSTTELITTKDGYEKLL